MSLGTCGLHCAVNHQPLVWAQCRAAFAVMSMLSVTGGRWRGSGQFKVLSGCVAHLCIRHLWQQGPKCSSMAAPGSAVVQWLLADCHPCLHAIAGHTPCWLLHIWRAGGRLVTPHALGRHWWQRVLCSCLACGPTALLRVQQLHAFALSGILCMLQQRQQLGGSVPGSTTSRLLLGIAGPADMQPIGPCSQSVVCCAGCCVMAACVVVASSALLSHSSASLCEWRATGCLVSGQDCCAGSSPQWREPRACQGPRGRRVQTGHGVWMHMENCVTRVMSACDSPLDHCGCCLAPPHTLLSCCHTHTAGVRARVPSWHVPLHGWLVCVCEHLCVRVCVARGLRASYHHLTKRLTELWGCRPCCTVWYTHTAWRPRLTCGVRWQVVLCVSDRST